MNFKKKEKNKKEQIEEVKPQGEKKVSRIKTDGLMKTGRVILWVVIIFLVFRGIVSIISPSSELRMEQIVTDYRADAELRETVQLGAAAFAEDFAREYYTFSGKYNSDYVQRVKQYLAKNTEIKSPVTGQYSTFVNFASAQKVNYQNSKDYDVDVHLQVTYTPINEGQEILQKEVYIRVPVSSNGKGRYAVTSLPAYIPQIEAAQIVGVDTYKGLKVESSEEKKIKETLNSFFSVYYGGTSNEISYYLTPDSNISESAQGMVEYQKLNYATVYRDEVNADYLVEAELTVVDNGQGMQQRLFIRMQYAKKHYYIKSINTRPI